MKAMMKYELAMKAGVSYRTFSRWLAQNKEELAKHGFRPGMRILPPRVVEYICDKYGINLVS